MSNFSTGDAGLMDSTSQWTDTPSLDEYPEYRAAKMIWKIVPPFILLLGGFGNVATIFVMRRIKDHNSSQHVILMSLAVSDFTVLCTDMMYEWLKDTVNVDLRLLHTATCKLLFLIVYVSGTMSSWLVTCVTVQRTMAVLWPHRMRVMCTVRRTWIVIVALVLTACALDSHVLVGIDISVENRCQTIPGTYRHFFVIVFSWVHTCLVSIVPSVCLFICDIVLSVTLYKAVSSSEVSTSSDSTSDHAHGSDKRKKVSYRTTVRVLVISCAFLVLTLPQCVYFIWASYIYKIIKRHPMTIPMVNLVYALTYQSWYLNSAINFYLYCLTGTKFRREFMGWICCSSAAQSSAAPSVQETASEASRGRRLNQSGTRPTSK